MTHYDYKVFKACNDKYNMYGQARATIQSVDLKAGTCVLLWLINGTTVKETMAIDNLVEKYIKTTMALPYLTKPRKIKNWKGFYSFVLNDETRDEINYMLIGIKEQYSDIVKGIGAYKNGLIFELSLKDKDIVFAGMMSSDIPFKTKKFSLYGKTVDELRYEIKSYLFDTLDGIVNV